MGYAQPLVILQPKAMVQSKTQNITFMFWNSVRVRTASPTRLQNMASLLYPWMSFGPILESPNSVQSFWFPIQIVGTTNNHGNKKSLPTHAIPPHKPRFDTAGILICKNPSGCLRHLKPLVAWWWEAYVGLASPVRATYGCHVALPKDAAYDRKDPREFARFAERTAW